jgi:hypothetical protein
MQLNVRTCTGQRQVFAVEGRVVFAHLLLFGLRRLGKQADGQHCWQWAFPSQKSIPPMNAD